MIRRHVFAFILSFSLLLLSGCISTSLTLNEKKDIVLDYGDGRMFFTGESVKDTYINLFPGHIHQYVSRSHEGTMLVFERTWLHPDYRYNHGTDRTLSIIFDAKKVIRIYNLNNMVFYQIRLKDSRLVNVVTQQSSDEDLDFVYGFDDGQFSVLMEQAKRAGDTFKNSLDKDVFSTTDPEKAILSQWRPEMLVIDVIFAPLRRMMMR